MSNEIVSLTGTVSHAREWTHTSGYVRGGNGRVRTYHRLLFRVDNRPVTMAGSPNIHDGDHVTVAGIQKSEFAGYAVRNHSTGVDYTGPSGLFRVLSWMMLGSVLAYVCASGARGAAGVVAGLFLSSPFLAIGLYLRAVAGRFTRSKQLLQAMSPLGPPIAGSPYAGQPTGLPFGWQPPIGGTQPIGGAPQQMGTTPMMIGPGGLAAQTASSCPYCRRSLSFITQYQRWFCEACKQYA
jgi:hypothetical protein